MWELCKDIRFESAHTLHRSIGTKASLRVHGHSYRARVCVRSDTVGPEGMIVDLDHFQRKLGDVHAALDHRMLDDIGDMGPATMENIARWIWDKLIVDIPSLARVSIFRDSQGEECTYIGGMAHAQPQ